MSRNFIVLDTEGVAISEPINRLGDTSLFYDFGFVVANREGETLASYSFVNTDVFMQIDLMDTSYYAKKLPQYWDGLNTDWKLANTKTIWKTFADAVRTYGVKDIWAYNANYDRLSCNFTINHFSNGFRDYFAPYGCNWRDIWDYAGETICATKKYVNWCIDNGFMTEKGNPSTSADTVGKYLRDSLKYAEKHTALSDAQDELIILQKAFKRKQKAVKYDKRGRYACGQGWRTASKINKTL